MIVKEIIEVNELDELVKIEEDSFSSYWSKEIYSKMLISEIYRLFGVYSEEKLTGFLCIADMTDVEEIIRIAISPNYRRKGFANKLLQYIFEKSTREAIFLEVRENNLSAIALYKKCGFEEICLRKNYYKDTNENAVVMRKNIEKFI